MSTLQQFFVTCLALLILGWLIAELDRQMPNRKMVKRHARSRSNHL